MESGEIRRKRGASSPFVLYNAAEACRILALFFAPFMPNTSAEVFRRLSLGAIERKSTTSRRQASGASCPAGNAVEIGDPLFPRLDVKDIQL